MPTWSPDGTQIAFVSSRDGRPAVHVKSLRGADDEEVFYEQPDGIASPQSWSALGMLSIEVSSVQTTKIANRDMGFIDMSDGTLQSGIASQFDELRSCFSPDGRFIAYDSNDTGRPEVYVQPYPGLVDRWRVSTDGGEGAFWRDDGRELYFVRGDSEFVAVDVSASGDGSRLTFGRERVLFRVDVKQARYRQIDTVDGKTFVLNRSVRDDDATPLTLEVGGLAGRFE